MDLFLIKPRYRASPIRSIAALARSLRWDALALVDMAERANGMWRTVKPKPGSIRQTFDAMGPLKEIHQSLKLNIFSKVDFPEYLQGSLKGRDYVSNASLHKDKQILICEDVKGFFPSVGAAYVEDVWCGFFGFAPDVAKLLTKLTTKDGCLPQGCIASSFLANLVLWRHEPLLHAKLAQRGITYSRYVDDMVMSAATHLDKATQTWVIAQVYGMLARHNLKASRKKHEVFSATQPMIATKLIVNRKPSLSLKKRSQVRAQVRQLEIAVGTGLDAEELRDLANKAAQQVGQLGRFHKTQAEHLRNRIAIVRGTLPIEHPSIITAPSNAPLSQELSTGSLSSK
ncbi:reverse transcriptase family protein [Curvibacter gracilis]|uniref:reverse transcriptase family protein n=1 Tax=Curvibacter gracilis TaxID=230310 RepID=UPI0009FE3776|nr:reverse transcriptase family protein [Curvibacter gracilis]